MGKMFGNLSTTGLEEAQDRLGGGSDPLPTGVYEATIKMAYAIQSAKGAHGVVLLLDINGREVRQTQYVTNKQGENFYVDKDDKNKKHPMMGFTIIDDICLFCTEMGLAEQDVEEKVVKIYNFDERKEIPTPVPVLTGLLNKRIAIGLLRVLEDKEKQDDSGKYVKTGETRTVNDIDKVFHPETKRTVNEYRHGVETSEFHDAWKARNEGNDRDKRETKGGAAASGGASGAGRPGAAAGGAAGAAAAPRKKLFA